MTDEEIFALIPDVRVEVIMFPDLKRIARDWDRALFHDRERTRWLQEEERRKRRDARRPPLIITFD